MNRKYEIANYPLWTGRVKSRQAKALARACYTFYFSIDHEFQKLKVGDTINDCSGFNKTIKKIIPEYYSKQRGQVLCSVTLVTHDGCHCSLTNCGIELNVSREVIEAKHLEFIEGYVFGSGGEMWYGSEDTWNDETRANIAKYKRRAETIRAGNHICDERGFLLDQFKT